MPFDGVVTKNVVEELQQILVGSRIEKIFQPEADEIIMNVRAKQQNLRLVLSASASYPRIHLTGISKENPSSPPMFCMLLRKHIAGGRITGVEFFDFERIVSIQVESVNELGDIAPKQLIIEIMGRHSNIILLNDQNKILDSIKHVDNEVSSVREVMPARPYILPPSQGKASIQCFDLDAFAYNIKNTPMVKIESYLLENIKGFSPLLCRQICHAAGLEPRIPAEALTIGNIKMLQTALKNTRELILSNKFSPCIIYEDKNHTIPLDFHSLPMTQYANTKYFDSINEVLDVFYSQRDRHERLKQKKADLVKVINNNIDRCSKKTAIHQASLRDAADKEKFRLYGELITANIYCITSGLKKVSLGNYYSESNECLDIPLDENLSPQQNAQRYFKKYSKARSTHEYATRQLNEAIGELAYLESVQHLLDSSSTLAEIEEIRQELAEQGYINLRQKPSKKKQEKGSNPLVFKSSDGFEIFVGKNNRQNDYLTMKASSSNDIWLHVRNAPGSHVVIRKLNKDIPESTLFEAAMLAAFHSRSKMSSNVAVDYTQIKHVKKPGGAKPGMVIYDSFKTIIVTPDESKINMLRT